MTIRINQIAVDFTLEEEHTLADLTASLRSWAAGQNLAILSIVADGRATGADDTGRLESVAEVEVEAVPAGERDLARAAVVARFFALLARGCRDEEPGLVGELKHEYAAVRAALFPLFGSVAHRLAPALAVLDGDWTGAWCEAAGVAATETEVVRRELQDPAAALKETLSSLAAALEAAGSVASLFQRARDRDALELIVRLFTLLEDLGRRADLYHRSAGQDGAAWGRFQSELQPFLKEAEAALNSRDFVLLSDLLEYEVTPRLSVVGAEFPELNRS